MAEINLQNLDHYYELLDYSVTNILVKYIEILIEYIQHCNENIKIINNSYKKYAIKKGISVISHVFNIILYYTKNLNMTYSYCRKSIIYYVEFMGQIENDMKTFLQLNSKDASLFVFKKTIYEISNNKKKYYIPCDNEVYTFDCIYDSTKLFNTLMFDYIQTHDGLDLKQLESKLYKIFNNVISLSTKKDYQTYVNNISHFTDYILCIDYDDRYALIEKLTKKILKHKMTKDKLTSKMHSEIFEKYIDDNISQSKIINYLFSS